MLRPIVEGAGGRVEQLVLVKPTGEPATTHTLSGALHHALERAGLPLASLHKLRHTCLSHLLAGGADLRTAQAIAGHKSITSTMRYLHAVAGMARAAVDRLATLRAEAEAEEVSAGGTDLTRAPATRRRARKLSVV
ncbi:Phage integrase family protein [Nannocystis exedens]|uniref:Phage integrase family protein n=1 Tax=Nannocystis exedens TaxID=54 RepID=A0A1I2BLN2_9BACT|nr:tyrosine-type recombinase/integrase [Nannocystis exedens]PCC67901.1 integrase [Nannocystis exedens]SFE57112.1 Phage integrase family protein [Nannocystis exedens]